MSKEFYIVTTSQDPERPALENIFLTKKEAFQAAMNDLFEMAGLCWDEYDEYLINNKIICDCDEEMSFIECENEGIEYKYNISAVTFVNDEDEPEWESDYLEFENEEEFDKWVDTSLKQMGVGKKPVNKLYPHSFAFAFYEGLGENDYEGVALLEAMGLDPSQLPFDIEKLLQTGNASWTDKFGGKVKMSFSLDNFVITTIASYNGNESEGEYEHCEEYSDWDEYTPAIKRKCLSSDIGRDLMMRLVEVFDWEKHPHPNHEA